MNTLNIERRAQVINCLVEGNSIRSTERLTGIHRDTIMRLMVRVGESCHTYMKENMKNLSCRRIQVDEIWTYVGKKRSVLKKRDNLNKVGDFWTFIAIDADTKLVPTFRVGKRDLKTATAFMGDLSDRLTNRIQLSSDAMASYVEATERAFGANVDYAQLVKIYEATPTGPGRYSPPSVVDTEETTIVGNPDPMHISTSYVERVNLTLRMGSRRFTRLTNAFSKKVENLKAAVALHFAHYNYVRIHSTLRCTPAMASKVTNRLWTLNDLVALDSGF